MFINKINGVSSNIGFMGYNHIKNDVGETIIKFNYPYAYNDGETCEIRIFKVTQTDKYNYKIDESSYVTIPLKPEGTVVNLQRDVNLDKDESFAYTVVRKDKDNKIIWSGADTGVKMHQENGEYVFRVHNDPGGAMAKTQPKDRHGNPIIIKNDAGEVIKDLEFGYGSSALDGPAYNEWKYTLVKQNGTTPFVQGPGYLAMPDTFIPGMRYKGFNEEGTGELIYDADYQKKMEGMIKTVSNMYGGNIAGLEAAVPDLKAIGIKKFFTTPLANGDNRTSHGYYNKNNFQVQQNMGTSENFDSLMKTEFKNGMNHVFDATLTSEGLEGIHIRYALRWGEDAQTANWFRLSGLKDAGIGFGVVPNNAKNLRHRVINPQFIYELQADGTYKKVVNDKYNANQETLLQIYDASQVTDEQLNKLDKEIDMYRELNAGKNLEINTYEDTTLSYVFEFNPNEYYHNVDKINKLIKSGEKLELNSPEGTIIALNLSNFHINKSSDGYVAWDDNPDMIKMNYGISGYDEKALQAITDRAERQHKQNLIVTGSKEVQDMAVQVGKYWADKVKTAHTIYTVQAIKDLKSAEKINKLIKDGVLPEEARISQNVVDNVLNGDYNLSPKGILNKDDVTIKALMQLPLDSLEFGENTVGVLSTSYFSNRATTDETIGVSRYDLMKQNNPHLLEKYAKVYNKVNDIYKGELKEFTYNVIENINKSSNEPLINADGNYTEYGEYIVELLGKSIAKYALLKSLSGDAFKYKILPDGTLTYDYENIKKATSLKALGIHASNPTEEAEMLLKKIQKGLRTITEQDAENVAKAISKMINGSDTNTFRLAEAIVEIAGLGLDFRLDAAKDVMDMDSVRNRETHFDDMWKNLINFWSRYVQGVKSVNPHSNIVAEMTNVNEVSADSYGSGDACPYNGWTNVNGAIFNGEPDAMTKFFLETGITSEAAYAYFFTELLTSFSRDFEQGTKQCLTHDDFKKKYDLLINTRSADYLRNLYTFMGNHDKTRTIHGLAVDMSLFQSTLMYNNADFNRNHKQRADVIRILSGKTDMKDVPLELRLNVDNLNYFRTVSARAVAQSKLLMDSINSKILNKIASKEDINLITEALVDLANGNYMLDKTTEKMTKINIPEISSIENAVKEVARIAKNSGVVISDREIQTIIKNANKLNLDDYLVHGDFDWDLEVEKDGKKQKLGDINKEYLSEILGNKEHAENYCLYTVQIARIIKDASKNSANADGINNALKDFITTYNRAKISDNMSGYKMYEDSNIARKKNRYAAHDFKTALELAINQAEFKSGKKIPQKEDIMATVYDFITEPALKKHAMIMSFLGGFCGISTLYAGDEYRDTGYEDKSKNTWVGDRLASRRSELENGTKYGKLMQKGKEVTYDALHHKATVKVLQNGVPYAMDVMVNGRNREQVLIRIKEIDEICKYLPKDSKEAKDLKDEQELLRLELAKIAYMMQNADGEVAISVFNASGINHDNMHNYFNDFGLKTKDDIKRFKSENNIDYMNPNNPYIPIQKRTEMDAILMGAGVSLPLGTIFINADKRDKAKYVVEKIGKEIGIVRKDGNKTGKIIFDGKTAKNGVMILKKVLSFKGRSNGLGIYNEQYNIVPTNLYKVKDSTIQGQNLSLISK